LPDTAHTRAYLQSRIHEERARHARHGHPFAIIIFEALPATDGVAVPRRIAWLIEALQRHVRPSDVIARAFEDTVVVLLVETDETGARDALFRLRGMIAESGSASRWRIACYAYPRDAAAIAELPLLAAA